MKSIIFLFLFTLCIYANNFKIDVNTKIYMINNLKAANTLANYIKKITSLQLPVTKQKDGKNLIIIGRKDKQLPFYNELNILKEDGFLIKTYQDNLYILGTNERGVIYGVYHFLEKYLGCKFLSPGFEYIPKNKNIVLKKIDEKEEPGFKYREIFIGESDDEIFALKNRLNGRLGHRAVENSIGKNIYNTFSSYSLVPDEKYRCNGQLDFSDTNVQKIAAKSAKEKLADLQNLKDSYILLEHQDVNSFCGNTPSLDFVKYGRYIAENIDTNVLIQAYQWSRKPPKNIQKLPNNLNIFFSPIEADFSKPLNSTILKDLQGWQNISDQIFIWHYTTNFGAYFQPYPNLYALDKDIKTFFSIDKVKGIFLQGTYGTYGGEFSNLRNWVFAKLLWNPKLSIDKLIEEFTLYYYGEGAQNVQEYIKILHNSIQSTNEKLLVKTSLNVNYLNSEFLKEAEKILERGLEQVKNKPVFKKHMIEVLSGIDYIKLMKGVDKNGKSLQRFEQFLNSNPNIMFYSEGGKIDNLKKIIRLHRKAPSVPHKAVNKDWLDFQEYALKLCCTEMIKDEQASDGVSAIINGQKEDWGFQLDVDGFPDGKWDIYTNVKIELNTDTTIIDNAKFALFYGVYDTYIKGTKLITQFENNKYRTIHIGTIDKQDKKAKAIWIRPPGNKAVKTIFVDRIFAIRKK